MSYVPFIICPYCNKRIEATVSGNEGFLNACGCKESRDAWERSHREEIERRKVVRRRGTKK